jgi:hypothetical protein
MITSRLHLRNGMDHHLWELGFARTPIPQELLGDTN